MITLFVFLSLMVTTWVKPFVIIQLCLLFSNHNKSRSYRNISNQKLTCPSFKYRVLLQLPQWQLGVSCGSCGWGSWNYLMATLPILLGKGPLVPINSWAVLYELHTGDNSMLLRPGGWYGHSRTFTSLFCSHWQIDLALCFGVFSMLEYPSTSHAKLQPWQVQNSQYYFWLHAVLILRSIWTIFPVPLKLTHPQIICDLLPSFRVGIVYLSPKALLMPFQM